jgi:vacuolar-type H+-ATPase subunit E/Vma4
MGIEKLTSSLLKDAETEAANIIKAAEGHIKKMKEDERAKIASLKKEAETDVEKILREQRNERLAWARLEAKRIISEAKEDAINSAIDDIFSSLRELKKSKEYGSFMSKEVSSALKELGEKATVHVVKSDRKLLPKLPKGCKVLTDLDALGGAVIESKDGKMKVDLTLETLFELRRDELRKMISGELFGAEKKK